MLDVKKIEENPEYATEMLSRKKVHPELIHTLLSKLNQRRKIQTERDESRSEANKIAKEISVLFKNGKNTQADKEKETATSLKIKIAEVDKKFDEISAEINEMLLNIPNFPHPEAPVGKDESDNVVMRIVNFDKSKFHGRKFKPHWELGEEFKLFDIERASKLTGSMFAIFRGNGARLLRAMINLALDLHRNTYTEIIPPHFVNSATFTGTGHLPKFADEAYSIKDTDYWMIPTAEVPLTGMHRDEMFAEDDLPIRYMSYTVCFRREAGAAGKDTRGLQRLHEFHKLELLRICKEENVQKEFEALVADAEKTLQTFELPYRVVDLCTGDLTFSSSRVYDLEVYAPGVEKWLEASSCGIFGDYQARRSNIRYKDNKTKKPKFVNFLNGSGLAIPRVFAAILENGWNEEGYIQLPETLHKYYGSDKITK